MARLNAFVATFCILFGVFAVGAYSQSLHGTMTQEDAVKAYDSGKHQEAQKILDTLVAQGRVDEVVYYFLGLLAQDKGLLGKAEAYYRKAIAFNPKYGEPYSDLSVLLLQQKKLAEAEQAATKATKLSPTFAPGFINLAAVQFAEKKTADARKNFLRAAKINPKRVLNQGSRLLMQYNNPRAAIYYYKTVLEAYPDLPMALLDIGQTYRILGEPNDALIFLKHGYDVTPTKDELFEIIYISYFRMLLDSGDYGTIIRTATDKVGTEYAEAQFFLALANFKLGKKAEFNSSFVKYFKLTNTKRPSSPEAWAKQMIKGKSVKPIFKVQHIK